MKPYLIYYLFLLTLFSSCKQPGRRTSFTGHDITQFVSIDSAFRKIANSKIQLISDGYDSYFKAYIEARFFSNGLLTDSIIDDNYKMTSWYSIQKDSIDLVVHIDGFESVALLLRFIHDKTFVRFYRAPHETVGDYFKINKNDPFSHQIEVVPSYYKLELSEIPDSLKKQVVYGHIDMMSRDYYDSRDSIEQAHKVQMKFYFRSQYKHYDY